jgi:hypothetical protein
MVRWKLLARQLATTIQKDKPSYIKKNFELLCKYFLKKFLHKIIYM